MANPVLPDDAGNPHFSKTEKYSTANRGSPDHYSLLVDPADEICNSASHYDLGCIHLNMGILNKAFYLMAVGGEHYKTTVKGIGERKLERIAYLTVMKKLKSTDGLVEAGNALSEACADLAGTNQFQITAADCEQVDMALKAVGLKNQALAGLASPASKPIRP